MAGNLELARVSNGGHISPEADIDSMSLPELEAFIDEEARRLIEAAGSVDAFLAHIRQYVSPEEADWHAAQLDRYR